MDRRSFLAALATVTAGCGARSGGGSDAGAPTATPVDVPADSPDTAGAIAVGESGIDPETASPENVDLFHRLESEPDATFLAPSRESFSGGSSEGWMYVRNRGDVTVTVDVGWRLLKYSGHRWVPIRAPQIGRNGASILAPGERWRRPHAIERVFGLPVLGPGLYARVERVRPESGDPRSVGALFRVSDTEFRIEARREPVERGEDVVVVELGGRARRELVLERIESADEGIELVPEAVGAIPMFRDSLPHLRTARTVRVATSSAEVAFQYLEWATAGGRAVEPGDPLDIGATSFEARIEERNR